MAGRRRRTLGKVPIYKVSGLAVVTMVTAVIVVTAAPKAVPKAVGAKWRGTILCSAQNGSIARSVGVDDHGRLAALTIRPIVSPGQKVELTASPARTDTAARARLLGRTTGRVIVRTRLIEDGQKHYRLYRNGRRWGCRVAFDDPAAISVAKLLLSGRTAPLRLGLRAGELVHLAPREAPRSDPVEAAKARADLERFLQLLARGRSIAACAVMARGAVLDYRTGCIMLLEGAKFVYRDRYAHASVGRIVFFDLEDHSYALATIDREHSTVRAILVHERGQYRYLRDFEHSAFELW